MKENFEYEIKIRYKKSDHNNLPFFRVFIKMVVGYTLLGSISAFSLITYTIGERLKVRRCKNSGLRGLATLSLSFGGDNIFSLSYWELLFLLQALECLFKAPSVKSFVKKLVRKEVRARVNEERFILFFLAFVFFWESVDRISCPISFRTHSFVPSIIGEPDSNTLLSFEILSLFFWLMAYLAGWDR